MELRQLSKLHSLDLSDNQLTGLQIGDAHIATLFKPHVSPSCMGSILVGLGELSKLHSLDLSDGQLTGL